MKIIFHKYKHPYILTSISFWKKPIGFEIILFGFLFQIYIDKCFYHEWGKWETIDERPMFASYFWSSKQSCIGTAILQKRFCKKCNKAKGRITEASIH